MAMTRRKRKTRRASVSGGGAARLLDKSGEPCLSLVYKTRPQLDTSGGPTQGAVCTLRPANRCSTKVREHDEDATLLRASRCGGCREYRGRPDRHQDAIHMR